MALERSGLRGAWWDRRHDGTAELTTLLHDWSVLGLLCNVQSRLLGGWLPFGRHWLAMRRVPLSSDPRATTGTGDVVDQALEQEVASSWVDLDSRLPGPHALDEQAVIARLKALLAAGGHLIAVHTMPHMDRR